MVSSQLSCCRTIVRVPVETPTHGFTCSYIRFGVREHAMVAICNGIAAHGGLIPFASTFLNFAGMVWYGMVWYGIRSPIL